MAAFQYPRTSQPQQPVGIDWGNPITRGLTSVFVFEGGNAIEVISGKRFADVGLTKKITSKGTGGSTSTAAGISTGTLLSNITSFSRVFVATLQTTGTGTFSNSANSGTSGAQIQVSPTAIEFNRHNLVNYLSVTGLSQGVYSGALAADGTSQYIYLNGVLRSSRSGTMPSLSSAGGGTLLSTGATSSRFDGTMLLHCDYNRKITNAEAAALSANPWQIFTPQARQRWVPTSGGANTYTMTPSGSITLTGVADTNRIRVQPSSGTVSFSGSAPFSQNNTYTFSISGAIGFSGTDSFLRTRTQVPTGEIAFSGTSILLKTRGFSPSGAITFSGDASKLYIRALVPTGQLSFYGTAPLIDPNAPTGVSTWRTLTGSGN